MAKLLKCDYNGIDIIRVIDFIQALLADEPLWVVDDFSYKLYCKEIRKYHFPDYDDEQRLMLQASQGNNLAINELFLSHLGLVIHVARKYQNRGLPLNDLISEGNIGLYNAIQKVNPNWNFRFGTYAVWYIRAAIENAIARDGNVVHYTFITKSYSRKIQKFISSFELQNGVSPSEEEIVQDTGIAEKDIEYALIYDNSAVSIDLYHDLFYDFDQFLCSAANLYEEPDCDLYQESLTIDMEDALDQLTNREKLILKRYFGIGCNQKDLDLISQDFDMSRERIRQIKDKAIRRLKDQKSTNLKQYLG